MGEEKSLEQIAFEAYIEKGQWRDGRGQPMLPWADVKEEIRDAWEVAAKAVETELLKRV